MNIKKWLKINTKTLKNKTIILTGSTGVLGNEIANILGALHANLVLADRNLEKSSKLKEELELRFNGIKVDTVYLDLQDLTSVRIFVNKMLNYQCIDGIIHNAGVYNLPCEENKDYNKTFTVNFISPYYITKMLMPKIKMSSLKKVVVVGSIAYKFAKFNAKDIDYNKCFNKNKVYGNSKRFLMLSLWELFKNEKQINFVVAQPGITPTNITRHFPKFLKFIIKLPMKIMFNSPKKSSLSVILAMFKNVNYHEWIGPKRFNIWGYPCIKKINNFDSEECKEIYQTAENIFNNVLNNH